MSNANRQFPTIIKWIITAKKAKSFASYGLSQTTDCMQHYPLWMVEIFPHDVVIAIQFELKSD